MPRRRREHSLSAAPDPLSLAAMVEPHLDWKRIKNYAPDTIKVRGIYIRRFAGWCDERGITHPEEITPAILQRYQRWLFVYRKTTGQPLTFHSQHARLMAIRGWFAWMAKAGHLPLNPAADIELRRTEPQLEEESDRQHEAQAAEDAQ